MTFTDYVFQYSKELEKTAVIYRNTEINYRELYRGINNVQNLIRERNCIGKESAMVISENSPFFIKAFYGIIKNGNVCIPVNPSASEDEVRYIIETLKINTFFIEEKCLKKMKNIFMGKTQDFHIYCEKDLENKEHKSAICEKDVMLNPKEDIAVIMFTSGSTATPKGVMLTHHNLMYNTESIIEYLHLNENDRVEVVLPFYYCYGTSLLNTHLRCCGSLVINNRFMFPETVLEDIRNYNCTGFAGVPSTYQILLRMTDIKNCHIPSLKYITQAGGKLQDTYINELIDVLKDVDIFIMYGQTEATARLSYLPPELVRSKMGSIGKGIPGTSLMVLNKEGRQVKPGEVGEIAAQGGNIMKGYLDDEALTKEVIKGGMLFTGDMATVDCDGYIYVVSREKNIIKCGGNRVSPKDIENVIVKIPEVVECAVVGVPHEILGEAVKAYVVLKTSNSKIDDKYIIDFCSERLVKYKVPKFVEFLDELPKNSSGKVMLKELQQRQK
jgi:long-chain acyl-CoA synthetase